MKKNIILLIVSCLIMFGCEKESELHHPTHSVKNLAAAKNYGGYGVSKFHDIMKFNNYSVLYDVINDMDTTRNYNINQFNNQFLPVTYTQISSMSDSMRERLSNRMKFIADSIGFSEDGIYSDFENEFSFSSLRMTLNSAEALWLAAGPLDWNANPQNSIIGGTIMKTFFNPYKEIMIGNSIFKYLSDSTLIEVTNGDYNTILAIRDTESSYTNDTNVVSHGKQKANSCSIHTNGHADSYFENTGHTQRIYGKVFSHTLAYIIWAGAETTHFSKVSGSWKKNSDLISVHFNCDTYYPIDCISGTIGGWGGTKTKYATHLEYTFATGTGFHTYGFKTGDVTSSHTSPGVSGSLAITF